ncbi:MAG: cell division protein FtsQ/DivIB [Pseudomonadota bacterium]
MSWKKISLGVLIAVAIIACFIGFRALSNRFLPITSVRVEGNFGSNETVNIQRLLTTELQPKTNFFNVRLSKVQASLQNLPWVASVDVKKVWPHELVIQIDPEKAIAVWNRNDFLNAYGETFVAKIPMDEFTSLPQLIGPDDSSVEMLSDYQQMSVVLAPLHLSISQFAIDAANSWSVQLSNGVTVHLGNVQALEQLKRFVKLYPKVFAARATQLQEVDLRYAHGMAVRWK